MTKRAVRPKNKKRSKKRQTNWGIIAGVVIGGTLIVGLMALAFRGPNQLQLAVFCENNPENCIVEGSAEAPVTIVEVSDYGCPHCKNFNVETLPLIEAEFVESGQVKWVVMPFALTDQSGNARTMDTAVAAFCAAEQDKFPDFHKAAFSIQDTPLFNTEEGLMAAAESAGLSLDLFAGCLADNDYEDIIRRNIQVAGTAGINSTPSFAVGEDILRGAQPFAIFQQRIQSLLES